MASSHQITTKTAAGTSHFGQELATRLIQDGRGVGRILCLYGDLGSGKTTFLRGFAKGLGYAGRLLSPTFIIVRRYDLKPPFNFFYHVDLYRLKAVKDLEVLGLVEIFADPASFVAVEWADRLGELPPSRVDLSFKVLESGEHKISLVYK